MASVPIMEQAKLEAGENTGAVLSIRWAPNGRHALSASKDGTVRLWNPSSGLLVRTFRASAREARDASTEPSGKRLIVASADTQLPLVDVASGNVLRKLRGHGPGGTHCVAFRSGDSVLASGGFDRRLCFWDARSSSSDCVDSVLCGSDAVLCVAFSSPDSPVVHAGCADGSLVMVDVRKGKLVTDNAGGPVLSLSLSGDSECALACVLDEHDECGVARLFDLRGGEPVASYRGFLCRGAKVGSSLSWDDAYSLVGGEDGRIHAWELVSAKQTNEYQLFSSSTTVTSLSQHPSTPSLLASGTDGTIRLLQASE
jgi:mitogen-activated protein kinase organizer 1